MIRPLRRAGRLAPLLFWLLVPLIAIAMLARWSQP
jgi:hypothetical protein